MGPKVAVRSRMIYPPVNNAMLDYGSVTPLIGSYNLSKPIFKAIFRREKTSLKKLGAHRTWENQERAVFVDAWGYQKSALKVH